MGTTLLEMVSSLKPSGDTPRMCCPSIPYTELLTVNSVYRFIPVASADRQMDR